MLKSLYARIVFRLIRPALVHLEHEEIRARGFVMESQPRVPPLDCQLVACAAASATAGEVSLESERPIVPNSRYATDDYPREGCRISVDAHEGWFGVAIYAPRRPWSPLESYICKTVASVGMVVECLASNRPVPRGHNEPKVVTRHRGRA